MDEPHEAVYRLHCSRVSPIVAFTLIGQQCDSRPRLYAYVSWLRPSALYLRGNPEVFSIHWSLTSVILALKEKYTLPGLSYCKRQINIDPGTCAGETPKATSVRWNDSEDPRVNGKAGAVVM